MTEAIVPLPTLAAAGEIVLNHIEKTDVGLPKLDLDEKGENDEKDILPTLEHESNQVSQQEESKYLSGKGK